MENKPNGNKTHDVIDNTPAPPKIFSTPTEAQVTDLFEESTAEDSNSNDSPQIRKRDLHDLTTDGEQIAALKNLFWNSHTLLKICGRPEKPTADSQKFDE